MSRSPRLAPVLLLALAVGCAEPWEEHCPAACAVVDQCGITAEGFFLHTYARYFYCCEPYLDGSTRREEWNSSGECLRRCVERSSCEQLERWITDKQCCGGEDELGACFVACGGY